MIFRFNQWGREADVCVSKLDHCMVQSRHVKPMLAQCWLNVLEKKVQWHLSQDTFWWKCIWKCRLQYIAAMLRYISDCFCYGPHAWIETVHGKSTSLRYSFIHTRKCDSMTLPHALQGLYSATSYTPHFKRTVDRLRANRMGAIVWGVRGSIYTCGPTQISRTYVII